MGSDETTGNFEHSRRSSDSSVVNLLSSDDEDDNRKLSTSNEGIGWNSNSAENNMYEEPPEEGGDIIIHRILGPPCGCRRNCRKKLMKNQPIVIFSRFWSLPTKFEQNCYLYDSIQVATPPRSISRKSISRRTITAYYSVDNGSGFNVNVCKTEFMNLHGLQKSFSRIDRIVKMRKDGEIFVRSDGRRTKIRKQKKILNNFN